MSWLYGLTLRTKLLLPIVIITSLAMFQGAMALHRFLTIDNQIKLLGDVNLAATSDLLETDAEVHKALVEERSLLFLNPESVDFAKSVEAHSASLNAAHEKMLAFRKRVPDAAFDAEFKAYEAARDHWEQLTKSVIAARTANTREGRTTAIEVSFKDGNLAFNAMRSQIYSLKERIHQRSIAIMAASEHSVESSRVLIFASIAVSLCIAISMALMIPKWILYPVKSMQYFVRRLIGEGGNLTQQIPIDYHDELGELGAVINAFISSLRHLVARVIDLGSAFHKQATTLKNLAQQNSTLVNRETDEISLVANAITALSQSVQSVAELAQEAASKTTSARSESQNGLQVVERTIGGIHQLTEKVKTSSEVIARLNTDSANIIGVVNVIKGIADQINLLALNAAIEAARAGEQGRGFAVVADSVRELAFRTAESTQEIQVMISKLQDSAHLAVEAMLQSQTIAQQSVHQAGETGQALQQINESVQRISGVNEKIASSANEQSAVADEIRRNTFNIAQYAKDGATLALQVATASDELEKVAGELDVALRKFNSQ